MKTFGRLIWVWHSSRKNSECVQYFPVSKDCGYGCQCLGFLTCAQILMHAFAHGGCTDTVRESALQADSGRKISSRALYPQVKLQRVSAPFRKMASGWQGSIRRLVGGRSDGMLLKTFHRIPRHSFSAYPYLQQSFVMRFQLL